ncbi:stage II sporulation protein P [Chengkuizengella sediminis]|uniref:stage II sporulation protein P n=1 Tax=Chengkuizengella sediminis TaxID=1885917 RepID=UPI00138954DA|nr:stage II sporulation protein P [Chengkuizengella sediminis]NDI33759.1 stage II sporulation protein P [Chengkuizengella sediminis]
MNQSTIFGVILRVFITLSLGTLTMFLMLSIGSYTQSKMVTSPIVTMQGLGTSVSSQFFVDMMAVEIPQMKSGLNSTTFSQKNVLNFLFRYMTSINPNDPKSLLASEVPGLAFEKVVLLRGGSDKNDVVEPLDLPPTHFDFNENNDENLQKLDPIIETQPQEDTIDQTTEPGSSDDNLNVEDQEVKVAADGNPLVFIYHSHNRESWLTESGQVYDGKTNVTALGKRLEKSLKNLGIVAVSSDKDYEESVGGYNWNFSYKYSLKTVEEAFAVNPTFNYFIDIHRDSQGREVTTINIDGVDYAKFYFIIGASNPNWRANEAFATKIHDAIEKQYPGISRGIWSKSSTDGNGEYNQSFSPNSIVIEVGGVENTIEESNRTIDLLAKALSDIVWEAEKVDTGVGG